MNLLGGCIRIVDSVYKQIYSSSKQKPTGGRIMALPEVNVDKTLDARGLSCPMPMLRTKKTLKDMKSGEVLEVLGTDPGSKK